MPRALASLVALSFPAEDSANGRLAGLSVTARGAYAESSRDELGFLHDAFTHDLKTGLQMPSEVTLQWPQAGLLCFRT